MKIKKLRKKTLLNLLHHLKLIMTQIHLNLKIPKYSPQANMAHHRLSNKIKTQKVKKIFLFPKLKKNKSLLITQKKRTKNLAKMWKFIDKNIIKSIKSIMNLRNNVLS